MQLKWIWGIASSLTFLALTCWTVYADDCPYRDGGYCIPVFTDTTSGVVASWIKIDKNDIISGLDRVQTDGVASLNYYESFWDLLIKKGKATQKDRDQAFEEASKAGGTKIGGVNLVVLAARTFQFLIDKGVMTKEEAQGVLNKARE